MSMSILNIHVHAACSFSCCMSMSMFHFHVHAARSLPAACPSTWCMLRVHVHTACPFLFFFLCFFVLQRAFFYFLCTVSRCDGRNRTRNIAVDTWRFIPLSYARHPCPFLCCLSMSCCMDIDLHHGRKPTAWTWTCSMNLDMHHRYRHVAWTQKCIMGMDMHQLCSIDMDMQHKHGHAA